MLSDRDMATQIESSNSIDLQEIEFNALTKMISEAWKTIAPFWPLKNLIACNPLQGLEDLSFEHALEKSYSYFQQRTLPKKMILINKETIKWCQAFFDSGQATITMPFRSQGLYACFRRLVSYDVCLHQSDRKNKTWLSNLPHSPEQAISECLSKLNIAQKDRPLFFTLLLTTLPGWASHIKYRTEWSEDKITHLPLATQTDFLAIRVIITCLLWSQATDLIAWYQHANRDSCRQKITKIINAEKTYRASLLHILSNQAQINQQKNQLPIAQFIFCIDIRSEPFRRALEAQGNYETFGFAGFFGIPVRIENSLSQESYASCPVLIKPKHKVEEKPNCSSLEYKRIYQKIERINKLKRIYQGLKYTFSTPFVLVEAMGPWCGLWMSVRTMLPRQTALLKQKIVELVKPITSSEPILLPDRDGVGIPFADQCVYAENALRIIGLTKNFARLVFICGHGSSTQNNTYASALDCGACGGHRGAGNARILAKMLNDKNVRSYLAERDIVIPAGTIFIAAQHNTTTDEMEIYSAKSIQQNLPNEFNELKQHLAAARVLNNKWRYQQMPPSKNKMNDKKYSNHVQKRSSDWAQTRPEWGLARNAAFIVAPRKLTAALNLEGRVFLHSYDFQQDKNGDLLKTILTAPMVVAQWINSQYLFSSLDNVAYGSGSKITHNVTGKIGVMQGNASDLMHGLPLQSIYRNDQEAYHEPLRLMTVVYAPRDLIDRIIQQQTVLQKLFSNGWVTLVCLEPNDADVYFLERDLTWNKHK